MRVCEHCGNQVSDQALFCGKCGNDIGFDGSGTNPAPQPPAPNPAPIPRPKLGPSPLAFAGAYAKQIVYAVFALVIVVGSVASNGMLGSVHPASAQEVANILTVAVNRFYSSDMDNDAAGEYVRTVWKYLPEDVTDAAIEECDGDKDEAIEKMSGMVGDVADSFAGKAEVRAVFSVGDKIDSSDIKENNNAFHDAKFKTRMKKGYELEVASVITAKEDIGQLEAGETKKVDPTSSGLQVVQIGDRWYIWFSACNSLLEDVADSSDEW